MKAKNDQIVTDIDGNIYNTIKIGTQVWMIENLKVTHYRNGDPILINEGACTWGNSSDGALCNNVNNFKNGNLYGKIYNWFAVNDKRSIAPEGWHIPTNIEWERLIEYLGGENVAGNKLKEMGVENWQSPNNEATNESGFTALPGGNRSVLNTFYIANRDKGKHGCWWSSTDFYLNAWVWSIGFNNGVVHKFSISKGNGCSVRCIKDYTALYEESIEECSDVSKNKYNQELIKDIEGNIYHSVTIGSQLWMAENLYTTKFCNGDDIPNIKYDHEWKRNKIGGYCDYENNLSYSKIFGRLYNWYSIKDHRNIAPKGWHIPTDEEWTILIDFLGGESEAGFKLKDIGFKHWAKKERNLSIANNVSGFTALPGGRRCAYGEFEIVNYCGIWWSLTEKSSGCDFANYVSLENFNGYVYRGSSLKTFGHSVRCIKDLD